MAMLTVLRFAFYGITGVFANEIQNPLPDGSTAGNLVDNENQSPGALDMGQQASTGEFRERSTVEVYHSLTTYRFDQLLPVLVLCYTNHWWYHR